MQFYIIIFIRNFFFKNDPSGVKRFREFLLKIYFLCPEPIFQAGSQAHINES